MSRVLLIVTYYINYIAVILLQLFKSGTGFELTISQIFALLLLHAFSPLSQSSKLQIVLCQYGKISIDVNSLKTSE